MFENSVQSPYTHYVAHTDTHPWRYTQAHIHGGTHRHTSTAVHTGTHPWRYTQAHIHIMAVHTGTHPHHGGAHKHTSTSSRCTQAHIHTQPERLMQHQFVRGRHPCHNTQRHVGATGAYVYSIVVYRSSLVVNLHNCGIFALPSCIYRHTIY